MLACGHPDGARMAVAMPGGIVDRCWACEVEADQVRRNAEEATLRRRRGRYPRRTIALGPPYDDGTIP